MPYIGNTAANRFVASKAASVSLALPILPASGITILPVNVPLVALKALVAG